MASPSSYFQMEKTNNINRRNLNSRICELRDRRNSLLSLWTIWQYHGWIAAWSVCPRNDVAKWGRSSWAAGRTRRQGVAVGQSDTAAALLFLCRVPYVLQSIHDFERWFRLAERISFLAWKCGLLDQYLDASDNSHLHWERNNQTLHVLLSVGCSPSSQRGILLPSISLLAMTSKPLRQRMESSEELNFSITVRLSSCPIPSRYPKGR